MHTKKSHFFIVIGSLFCAALLMSLPSTSALCVSNSIAFRPLLTAGDLEGKKFDVINYKNAAIYVWKLRYLADRDINKVEIFRSAENKSRLLVGFSLNSEGVKRLRHFTKKFGMRRLAVFADGKLLDAIPAVPPAFVGDRIVVKWPGTEKELRLFATNVNKRPPGIISLYIEEMGRYNEVAADAWASAYEGVSKFINSRQAGSEASKAMVDEMRSQGD